MDVFFNIISFFTNFYTEIMVTQLLFCLIFPKRKYWYLAFLGWIGFDVLFFCIPDFYSLQGPFVVFGWLNLFFVIAFLCSTLGFFGMVKIPLKDLIFYSSAAYALQNLVHNVSYILSSYCGVTPRESWGFLITLGLLLLALAVFYFLIIRRIKKGEITAVTSRAILILSVSTLMITYFLSMYFLPVSSDNNIARFYAALCCLFLLFIQFSLFEKSRMEKDKETVENLLYAEQKQHDVWKENVEIINVKCHDLKHQIAHLCQIEDTEERKKSFKEVQNAIMIYDSFVKTGNPVLDVVLTEKSMMCEKNEITYSFLVDGKKLEFINEYDLCSLFGNILDNAIESCSKVKMKEKRTISLNVNAKGNLLSVHADNVFEDEIHMENGIPMTNKSDKRFHGFGIKSIQMIVEKYGGTFTINIEDHIFNIDILFMMKSSA